MKVLILDAYYYPEKIAFTHLENDLITGLVDAGYEVEIICPVPTRGVDKETIRKYNKIKYEEAYEGKVHVRRFWAPQEGINPVGRALRYVWCNLREYQIGKREKDIEWIFANSTPPTQGWLAGKLKKKLGCKFIYSLQDIFPDSLQTTGLSKEGSLLYKIGSHVANASYKAADTIVVISKSFEKNLIKKGVSSDKIRLIYNWVDTDKVFHVSKSSNKLFDDLGISRDIPTVVYAGNFGASQNGGIILDAAKRLEERHIQFVIFGGGSEYPQIRERIHAEMISNVYAFDLMPVERVSEVYCMGDVALITNAPGVGDCGMPSKLWTILATDTPIIASVDEKSELAEVIRMSCSGMVVQADDVNGLVDAILQCTATLQTSFGRDYVKSHADKKQAVSAYLECLRKVGKNNV